MNGTVIAVRQLSERAQSGSTLRRPMKSLIQYRELIRNLVVKDLKLKYRDSTIGFLWSLVNPLLLILVYSFVFSHILKAGIANFSYFLLIGILPWNFFAQKNLAL